MNLRRFEALIDHLEIGVLGHERFDFRVLNSFDYPRIGRRVNVCGDLAPDTPYRLNEDGDFIPAHRL
jgi:hypothetical protein